MKRLKHFVLLLVVGMGSLGYAQDNGSEYQRPYYVIFENYDAESNFVDLGYNMGAYVYHIDRSEMVVIRKEYDSSGQYITESYFNIIEIKIREGYSYSYVIEGKNSKRYLLGVLLDETDEVTWLDPDKTYHVQTGNILVSY